MSTLSYFSRFGWLSYLRVTSEVLTDSAENGHVTARPNCNVIDPAGGKGQDEYHNLVSELKVEVFASI